MQRFGLELPSGHILDHCRKLEVAACFEGQMTKLLSWFFDDTGGYECALCQAEDEL